MSTIEKATQALNFFARKSQGEPFDKMKALKLVYFADRYHLRRYGRPVVGDHYRALPWGPVPQVAYHAATQKRDLDPWAREYVRRFLTPLSNYNDQVCWISSNAEVDTTVFSESDLEALNFAWLRFKDYDGRILAKLTHIFPEWDRHKHVEPRNSAADMDYLDFFLSPAQGVKEQLGFATFDDPFTEDHRLLELSKETFLRQQTIAHLLS